MNQINGIRNPVVCAPVVLCLLAACANGEAPPSPEPSAASAALKSAGSAPSAEAKAPGAAGSLQPEAPAKQAQPLQCKREHEQVHGTGVNTLTGLTTKKIGGDLAIGYAVGAEPRVLLLDKKGGAKTLKVKTGQRAEPPDSKEGHRLLMRVSPVSVKGEQATAFIDFRDEFKDKRRRVSCGPADGNERFLSYEGKSWLDLDPKPTGEEKKKLFSWKKLGGYVELRDCRTFVNLKSEQTWALGSVLRGIEKEDGSNEWKMVLVVDFGAGDDEIVLHEVPLKGDPPKVFSFEIPNSRRVQDKGFVVAMRYAGSLMVGVLDNERKPKGRFKSYRGYPTMLDIGTTEGELLLTTGIGSGKEKSIKTLRVPRDTLELPAGYTDVALVPMDAGGDESSSFTAPEISKDSKEQLWLAYVEGPKDKGHLRLAPLDKDLKPMGGVFSVTEGDVYAREARVMGLEDGRLSMAYIRQKEGKTELVTEEVSCELTNPSSRDPALH